MNVSTRTSITAAFAVAALLILGDAFATPGVTATAPEESDLKALYWQGHEALKVGDYTLALCRRRQGETTSRRRPRSKAR